MKHLLRISAGYTLFALLAGVFYREFTKLNAFEGTTALSALHPHALVLGAFVPLLLIALEHTLPILQQKGYKWFMAFYQSGLLLTLSLLTLRGVLQVLQTPLTNGQSAAISGIAGLGHMSIAVGFFLLYRLWFRALQTK